MKRRPRICYSASQRALMWEHWRKGETLHQIDLTPYFPTTDSLKFVGSGIPRQSLFAAYRAIEALGLTVVGASGKKPSVRGGVWDREIRDDLEGRLQRVGISPSDTFLWHARGRPTGAQRKLRTRTSESTLAPWAGGVIRDERIPYVDAINHAQWLRNSTAAHQTKDGLRGLHPLDTVNVQHLTRMLIFKAAKFK